MTKLAIKPKAVEPSSTVIEKPKNYFTNTRKPNINFISSGCCLLDCVLGGGWPLGRISNVVGDSSSGKTGLAIEASANFIHKYRNGKIYYNESEAAFDEQYAQAIGMPIEKVDFVKTADHTIEGLFEHLQHVVEENQQDKCPVFYIVDSLDGLSDRAEQKRAIDEATYSMGKQKKLSELFRRLVDPIEKSNIHLMIISQVRDNIGVAFGEKHVRTGGKSLNFYASQVLWLAQKGKLKRTIKGIEKIYGVDIKANCKKNKVGLPHRICDFPIIFGYGINDILANLEFLKTTKSLDQLKEHEGWNELLTKYDFTKPLNQPKLTDAINSKHDVDYNGLITTLENLVVETWETIETEFLPKVPKHRR